jgi:hypothetical protein
MFRRPRNRLVEQYLTCMVKRWSSPCVQRSNYQRSSQLRSWARHLQRLLRVRPIQPMAPPPYQERRCPAQLLEATASAKIPTARPTPAPAAARQRHPARRLLPQHQRSLGTPGTTGNAASTAQPTRSFLGARPSGIVYAVPVALATTAESKRRSAGQRERIDVAVDAPRLLGVAEPE